MGRVYAFRHTGLGRKLIFIPMNIAYKECTYRAESPNEQLRQMFEQLWKEKLILIPPLDGWPSEQCYQLKEWAWEIYKEMRKA